MQDGGIEGEFKMLAPEDLLSNNIDQLRMLVSESKEEDCIEKKMEKKTKDKSGKGGKGGEAVPDRRQASSDGEDDIEVSPASVSTLNGHESEVYCCQWSPSEPLLASGWVPCKPPMHALPCKPPCKPPMHAPTHANAHACPHANTHANTHASMLCVRCS